MQMSPMQQVIEISPAQSSHLRAPNSMHFANTLQRNTLQHTAKHRNTLQHTATHCNALQHIASTGDKLNTYRQHTATHCNTSQYTATPATHRNDV